MDADRHEQEPSASEEEPPDSADPGPPSMDLVGEADPGSPDMEAVPFSEGSEGSKTSVVLEDE